MSNESLNEPNRSRPASKARKLSSTSPVGDGVGDGSSSGSLVDTKVLELAEERRVLVFGKAAASGGGTSEKVDLAAPAERRRALSVGSGVGRAKELALVTLLHVLNVFEDVALPDTARARVSTFEKVALNVSPDVVDGVQKSLSAERGTASGGLGDVVVLHADGVGLANHLENPIVVVVATGRVVGLAVDEVAGKLDACAGCETKDVVLTARTGSLEKYVSESTR